MGILDYIRGKLKETEEKLDEEYEDMEPLEKLVHRKSFPVLAAAIGFTVVASPFLYLASVISDCSTRQEYAMLANQKAQAAIKKYQEEHIKDQEELMEQQERLLSDQSSLRDEQHELRIREIKLESLERRLKRQESNLESDRGSLAHKEKMLETDEEQIAAEMTRWEMRKAHEREILENNKEEFENIKKKFEEESEQLAQALRDSARKKAETSLIFVQSFDLNKNYITDELDSEISRKKMDGISILSYEYLSSVRLIHNPEILKKLSEYNIKGPVICINDETLIEYEGEAIKRVIEDVPSERLFDFQFNPRGKEGLEQILSSKKKGACAPVALVHEEFNLGGSGFVLGDGYIVTAYHVAEVLCKYEVRFDDGRKIKAKKEDTLVAYSKEHDLAVFRLDFSGYGSVCLEDDLRQDARISYARPRQGNNFKKGSSVQGVLYSIESMAFQSLIDDEGKVPRIHGTDLYLTTMEALPGDSGSGVLDSEGRLIGVASSMHNNSLGAACVVRTKYLRKLLETYCREAE